jgi:hypothetical protein
MPHPSHLLRFEYPNNIRWKYKLGLSVKPSPEFCYFLSFMGNILLRTLLSKAQDLRDNWGWCPEFWSQVYWQVNSEVSETHSIHLQGRKQYVAFETLASTIYLRFQMKPNTLNLCVMFSLVVIHHVLCPHEAQITLQFYTIYPEDDDNSNSNDFQHRPLHTTHTTSCY